MNIKPDSGDQHYGWSRKISDSAFLLDFILQIKSRSFKIRMIFHIRNQRLQRVSHTNSIFIRHTDHYSRYPRKYVYEFEWPWLPTLIALKYCLHSNGYFSLGRTDLCNCAKRPLTRYYELAPICLRALAGDLPARIILLILLVYLANLATALRMYRLVWPV